MPQRTPEACPRGESSGTLGRSVSVMEEEYGMSQLARTAREIIRETP